ncbi:MAG: DUF4255 domain-containing protein [Myxococcaceae bacterium]|nr:DUF4255 domain-containing protein [Myxococcaceae bacterium]
MSNHLAIATVTAALRLRLEQDLQAHLTGASATTIRPISPPSTSLPAPGVNIFLFQVTPNTALRNEALPTRGSSGQLLQRPVIALDLHYLLSFYGTETKQEPQVAMGIVARSLQAQPTLTRTLIEQAVAAASHLEGSDLVDSLQQVRFFPTMASVEDIWKLWSVFQTPYVLSATYQASVVLIEGPTAPRAPALPVRGLAAQARALRQPVIERVLSQATGDAEPSAGQPILVGHRLILQGQGLLARTQTPKADTLVRIGDVELAPESASPDALVVLLPTSLKSGVQRVQVVHQEQLGGVARRGAESSAVALVLQPDATFAKVAEGIEVTLSPQVQKGQRAVLLLNQYGAPAGTEPKAYSFPLVVNAPAATLTFPISTVAAGDYLLRVQVDGAESPLVFSEAEGRYAQPRLTLP